MSAWPTQPLGRFIASRSGFVDPSKFSDEEFDLYSIPAFDHGQPERRFGREIGSAKPVVQPGDVLLSRIVPHIRRAWVVPNSNGRRLLASSEWIVFRTSEIKAPFLRYFLSSDHFHRRFMRTLTGVGGSLTRAAASEVSRIDVPLPPLEEQQRIVKLLDEADALRKLRADADCRTADLIPALFHDMFGDERSPIAKPLEEICVRITDGVHLTPTYVENGVPFLRVTDIQTGEIDWRKVKRIPQFEYEAIVRRIRPERGDILYSKNGTIGIAKEITWEQAFAHFVSLALLKPIRSIINPTFLTAWLNTPAALSQARAGSKTGTVTNLHLNEIRKIRVPCPPLEDQLSFVRHVADIRGMEAAQAQSKRRLDALFQSMLHRAFAGEL